jgi:hypothetical protein
MIVASCLINENHEVNFRKLLIRAMAGTLALASSLSLATWTWSFLLRSRTWRTASITSAILIPLGHRTLQVELGVADDLVGKDIHLADGRTAGRALAALIAGQQFLTADLLNLIHKIVPDFLLGDVGSHFSFSLSGLKGSILNIKMIFKAKTTLQ